MHIKSQMGLAFFLCMMATTYTLLPPSEVEESAKPVAFLDADPSWVYETMARMTLDQKIGQFVHLVQTPGTSAELPPELLPLLGGVLLDGFSSDSLPTQIDRLDTLFYTKPLIGVRGTGFSPQNYHLPAHPGIGQIRSDSLVYMLAYGAAQQLRTWGGHYFIQQAPVRYFSEDNLDYYEERLAKVAFAARENRTLLMLGEASIYFPRMRDTLRRDSIIRIYKKSARRGLDALVLDATELEKVHPGSYRNSLIRIAAQKTLNFEGLVLVPSRDSIGNYGNWVELFVKSGGDAIYAKPRQVKELFEALKFAVESNKWTYEDMNRRLFRLLLAKAWTTEERKKTETPVFTISPHLPDPEALNQRLERSTLTLVRNQDKLIPLRDLKKAAVHLLTVGEPMPELLNQMRFYGPVSHTHLNISRGDTLPEINIRKYRRYDPVIVALNLGELDTALHRSFLSSLRMLEEVENVLVLNNGPLENLSAFTASKNLLQAYHNHSFSQKVLGQALFGGFGLEAVLPIEINEELVYGMGSRTKKSRLAFSPPEEMGLDRRKLARIDTIVYEGMRNLAMPGCQVLVVKNGEIVYDKAFGYQTYARRHRVLRTDLYDIASVTKVAATTLASMKMVDSRKLRLGDRLGRFFKNKQVVVDSIAGIDSLWVIRKPMPDSLEADTSEEIAAVPVVFRSDPNLRIDSIHFEGDSTLVIKTLIGGKSIQKSRIFDIRIKDLLTHHSGLPAGLPIRDFVIYRRKGYGIYDKYFSPSEDDEHKVEVAGRFFMRNDYLDTLWEKTKAMELDPFARYKYSDANFVLLQQAIDSINNYPIDSFLNEKIYRPMGLQYLGFRPRERFKSIQIIPTERDKWRNQLLRGYVHDPTAALLGGVSGNAGLFSNAEDLAHLFQMLLQGGWYGEERFLKKETIFTFTRIQKGDRGYGFDMVGQGGNAFAAYRAPLGTFGHTGFTGTCVWVDPENELVYIFLANRVHPRANNWKLNELRIRQRIHEAIYEAMTEYPDDSLVDLK